jgi:hypothetical protein
MRTWLTARLQDGVLTVNAVAADDFEDSADVTHTVTEALPVVLPAAVARGLAEALESAGPALSKSLRRAKARHMAVAEDVMDRRAKAGAGGADGLSVK